MRKLLYLFIFFFLVCFLSADAQPLVFNLTPGVTPISKDIYSLHMIIYWICVGIGVIVFGVLIYALINHRQSKGHAAAEFHEHLTVELIWVIIPFIILVIMAIPATLVLIKMNDTAEANISIKITGFQWKWKYDYLDYGLSFFSNIATPQAQIQGLEPRDPWYLLEVDKPLVLPIHKKIRFFVTSNDVIHSWWVPALGIKRDAIPGFIYEAWARIDKPGTYRGQCAELCGMNHAYMPIVVIAKTEADFKKWLAQQKLPTTTVSGTSSTKGGIATTATTIPTARNLTQAELMDVGKKTYETICAVCHKPDGTGLPPAFPTMIGSKIATGPVADHINIVVNGKPGTAMQAFKTQLTPEQIAAVITYERNSWGNADQTKYGKNAGGLVQASDIK